LLWFFLSTFSLPNVIPDNPIAFLFFFPSQKKALPSGMRRRCFGRRSHFLPGLGFFFKFVPLPKAAESCAVFPLFCCAIAFGPILSYPVWRVLEGDNFLRTILRKRFFRPLNLVVLLRDPPSSPVILPTFFLAPFHKFLAGLNGHVLFGPRA